MLASEDNYSLRFVDGCRMDIVEEIVFSTFLSDSSTEIYMRNIKVVKTMIRALSLLVILRWWARMVQEQKLL